MPKELLRLASVSKRHNTDLVLQNVSLSIFEGEVVTVVSDNVTSQNMLAKILGGLEQPDAGELHLDGSRISITSPFQGRKLGISVIYKKYDLLENLTVKDNLYLDQYGFSSKQKQKQKEQTDNARELLKQLNIGITPEILAGELTAEQKQLLQLVKAYIDKPRLLVIGY